MIIVIYLFVKLWSVVWWRGLIVFLLVCVLFCWHCWFLCNFFLKGSSYNDVLGFGKVMCMWRHLWLFLVFILVVSFVAWD